MDKDQIYKALIAKHGVENVKVIMLDSGGCIFLLCMTKCKYLFNLYAKAMPLARSEDLVNLGKLILNYTYLDGAFGDEEEYKQVDQNTMDYVSACLMASKLFVLPEGNVLPAKDFLKSGTDTPQ